MSTESSTTHESSHQQKLRLELKEWEKGFAAANGGRKAGREDIKKEPEIGISLPTLVMIFVLLLSATVG